MPFVPVILGAGGILLIRSLNNNTHPSISERAQKKPRDFRRRGQERLARPLIDRPPSAARSGKRVLSVPVSAHGKRPRVGGTSAGPRGAGVAADSDGPSCRLSGPGRRRMRHFRHDRCGKCGRSWLGSRLLGAASVIGDASYRGRLAAPSKDELDRHGRAIPDEEYETTRLRTRRGVTRANRHNRSPSHGLLKKADRFAKRPLANCSCASVERARPHCARHGSEVQR